MKSLGPSFPFYVDDFVGGTMHMSTTEAGAYIRLLCYQWSNGSCPSNPVLQTRICGYRIDKLKSVLDKFEVCPDGLLRNKKMESIRLERMAYMDEQARKAKLGADARWHVSGMPGRCPTPCPDDAPPSPSASPIAKEDKSKSAAKAATRSIFVPPEPSEVTAYGESISFKVDGAYFVDYYQTRGWKLSNGRKMVDWKAGVRTWKRNDAERNGSVESKSQPWDGAIP